MHMTNVCVILRTHKSGMGGGDVNLNVQLRRSRVRPATARRALNDT